MNIVVEKHLKELLLDFDCVIVPNFGGFIATYMGSEISIAKNKITPPRKQIAFNDKLTTNDSLLIDYIADNENSSILDAYNAVDSYVAEIKNQVKENAQYTIESLGRIYLNEDGNYNFEQYLRFNYLKESFGLPDLYFKPIDRTLESKTLFKTKKPKLMASTNYNELEDDDESVNQYASDEEMEEVDLDEFGREKQQKKSENLAIYYVMAIIALVITAGTAYYLNMDKQTFAIGSFSPLSIFGRGEIASSTDVDNNKLLPSESEDEQPADGEATGEQTDTYTPPAEQSLPEDEPTNLASQNVVLPVQVNIDPQNIITDRTGRFYIVAGGFKSKNKAARLLSEMINAGNSSKIIDSYDEKGVYRVTVADYSTYDEAQAQKKSFIDAYGDELWVLGY